MPAAKPVLVTGMQWTGALLAAMEGTVKVALMSWWTTKGEDETKLRKQEEELLSRCVRKWGDLLVHVFDRGYASGPWIQLLQSLRVRFVIRWIKKHYFLDANGREKQLWPMGQGKKYFEHQLIYDPQSAVKLPGDIWWAPVRQTSYAEQVYVVKVRVRKKVWYLITNEPIKTADQAWDGVLTYKRRWQMEAFHQALKTGCRMAQRYLQSVQALWQLVAVLTPMALRWLLIGQAAQRDMAIPATRVGSQEVIHLVIHLDQRHRAIVPAKHLWHAMARLGGDLDRSCDGPAGWQTLWKGWIRVMSTLQGVHLAAHFSSP